MKRELVLLCAGLVVGAALAWWLAGPGGPSAGPPEPRMPAEHATARVESRSPAAPAEASAGSAASETVTPSAPADPKAAGRAALRDLELATARLDVDLQRLLVERAGGPPAVKDKGPGYGGNPFAGKDPSALGPLREEAERKVEEGLARWRAAVSPKERAAAMRDLANPMRQILETGGSMAHLRTLEDAAERGETPEVRTAAVIATHTLWQTEAVDFLLARARSPHPEVRFYAVEGLAWVRGTEALRAGDGVLAGLEDPDPKVRAVAATSMAVVEARPERAAAIRDRLARETDPAAKTAMEEALRWLEAASASRR